MKKLIISIVTTGIFTFSSFLPLFQSPSFAANQAVDYLCELGITFYKLGRYDEALMEFNKTLLVDPKNATAKSYIDKIFAMNMNADAHAGLKVVYRPSPEAQRPAPVQMAQAAVVQAAPAMPTRSDAVARPSKEDQINNAFEKLAQQQPSYATPSPAAGGMRAVREEGAEGEEATKGYEVAGLKVTGEMQISGGVTPDHTIWKRANYDLNSKNWRMGSDQAYNYRFNTYDPRIYDSLSVNLDTDNQTGFNFHSNLTVDPWSFTGKGPKTTVSSLWGDTAVIEPKYWSNTGYLVNETYYTKNFGNSFNLPETKVQNGKYDAFNVGGAWGDTFYIPGAKLDRQFQPVRELWLDYQQEGSKIRLFPMGYQDQAFSSDDPLRITNHHMWWENSLWLRRYMPGNYNFGQGDFTKGYYDNSLAELSRDSNGTFLTGLRGGSVVLDSGEGTVFSTTVASPKHLWQDYEEVDNLITASRLKHNISDRMMVGSTFTSRTAFNTEDGSKVDATNFVGGVDFAYEFMDGIKSTAEVLTSRSKFDKTSSGYETESRGNAYYASVFGRYPFNSVMDLEYGYDQIKPGKDEKFIVKSRIFAAYVDEGFTSALSSFRNTRSDAFWSRHLTFRRPFDYYYAGLKGASVNWDQINAVRIGDGIDVGRNSVGFRTEVMHEKFDTLTDIRSVHDNNGKIIETVFRNEATVRLSDKLTAKGLTIYHDLPQTAAGVDPYLIDANTGLFLADWSANPIDGDRDPSVFTGSFGLEYAFYEWLAANFVFERTNDHNLGYGSFPRSVLIGGMPGLLWYEEGRNFRANQVFLYDQQLFPQPPFHYYNIYKCGLRFQPIDKIDIYLDYTRNEYAVAGQNTDNMNHVGLEMSYTPSAKFGMAFKYTYSRWKDLDLLTQGVTKVRGHHNFFSELRYLPSSSDEFVLQYGEGGSAPVGNITFDPYGGNLATLDTQHIVRAYYRRRF